MQIVQMQNFHSFTSGANKHKDIVWDSEKLSNECYGCCKKKEIMLLRSMVSKKPQLKSTAAGNAGVTQIFMLGELFCTVFIVELCMNVFAIFRDRNCDRWSIIQLECGAVRRVLFVPYLHTVHRLWILLSLFVSRGDDQHPSILWWSIRVCSRDVGSAGRLFDWLL